MSAPPEPIRTDDQHFVSGHLKPEVWHRLPSMSIRSVVDIDGKDSEAPKLAAALKLPYRTQQVTIDTLSQANVVNHAINAVRVAPKPVLVMCSSGKRARFIASLEEASSQSWTVDEGTGHWKDLEWFQSAELRAFALEYLRCIPLVPSSPPTEGSDEKKPSSDTTPTPSSSIIELKGRPVVHCLPHIDSGTCSYVVSCPDTKDAVVIDPVLDYDHLGVKVATTHIDAIDDYVRTKGFNLKAVIDTHAHADHLSGAPVLTGRFKVPVFIGRNITKVQAVFGDLFNLDEKTLPRDGRQFGRLFADGDQWMLGNVEVEVISTPGHTPACMSWRFGDAIFIGDTLFMPDIGTARCDFPGGSVVDMWNSIQRLLSYPESTRLFLCHDYPPAAKPPAITRPFRWECTVGEQQRLNDKIRNREEFIKWRTERDQKMEAPKLLWPSLQTNIRGGRLPASETNGMRYFKLPLTGVLEEST